MLIYSIHVHTMYLNSKKPTVKMDYNLQDYFKEIFRYFDTADFRDLKSYSFSIKLPV